MSFDFNIPSKSKLAKMIEREWQQFHEAIYKRNNWYRNGRYVYQFVFAICVPAFLVLFGLLGNGLSIAVLRRRKLSSATMLLITLAIVDSLMLTMGFLFEGFPHVGALELVDKTGQPWHYYTIVQYLVGPFVTATESFECCTMVVLGVDR